ncbi:MAG: TauD/TfdA family dioxygenase [Archangium sp.]|nr:TauD/TfdA family dioxygenase [Archangium sp.]
MIREIHYEPATFGRDWEAILERVRAQRETWAGAFEEHPALLFKGFPIADAKAFAAFAQALTGQVSRYLAGQTDRTEVTALVYEATKIPSVFPIALHAEMAYSKIFPSHLLFFSEQRRCVGGASWLADNAAIWEGLPAPLREKLEHEGILYRRLLPPLGAPVLKWFRAVRSGALKSWQESLEVAGREQAESALASRTIPFTWTRDGWLDLSSRLPAFREVAGRKVWFNQCHTMQVNQSFHGRFVTTLHRLALRQLGRNPFGAAFGDGSPFSDDDFRAIRRAHDGARRERALQRSEVLFFDNLRLSHGRGAYLGTRTVRVAFCGLPG